VASSLVIAKGIGSSPGRQAHGWKSRLNIQRSRRCPSHGTLGPGGFSSLPQALNCARLGGGYLGALARTSLEPSVVTSPRPSLDRPLISGNAAFPGREFPVKAGNNRELTGPIRERTGKSAAFAALSAPLFSTQRPENTNPPAERWGRRRRGRARPGRRRDRRGSTCLRRPAAGCRPGCAPDCAGRSARAR